MREPAFIWRLLTGPELTDVYLNEMRRDFPAGELKPLSMILNSEADGTAHTWGVFDGDTLAAYLLMVRPEGCRMSQLDYFAVVPAYRAHGIGAQLLAQLPAHEDTAEAKLIKLCIKFAVKCIVLVHVIVARLDFILGEFTHHIADHSLFFVEFNKHRCSPFLFL